MQWADDGIVLGVRRHAESAVVLEILTRAHGRHLGLVHGGRSKRLQPVLQTGNAVHATWRARLDEHLGTYAIEPDRLRAGRLIGSPMALHGLSALAALVRLLPEREPHPLLYEQAGVLFDHLDAPALGPALFVRFELSLLAELGFGLDLAACAATGATADLAFVSPKSGRAVSAEAGAPYADRLFALPAFLRGEADAREPPPADIAAGFALTEHFLRIHLFEPRGIAAPEARVRFAALAAGR